MTTWRFFPPPPRLRRVLSSAILGLLITCPIAEAETPGQIDWIRQTGTSNTDISTGMGTRVIIDVTKTTDGYEAGWTEGSIPGYSNAGGADAVVRYYDVDGNVMHSLQFGTSGDDKILGIGCVNDGSQCYVVGTTTGSFPGYTNAGGIDIFVSAVHESVVDWTKQFGTSGTDIATSVSRSSTNVLAAGYTTGSFPGFTNAGGEDAILLILDFNDSPANSVYQYGTSADDRGTGVTNHFSFNSDIIFGGYTEGTFPGQVSAGGRDLFLMRFDVYVQELWTRQFGTSGNDTMNSIRDLTGQVTIAGETDGGLPGEPNAGGVDALAWKYDDSGNEIWKHVFGTVGTDRATSAFTTYLGTSFVAGSTTGTLPGETSAGGVDFFVRKYDSIGNALWSTQDGTIGDDSINGISGVPTNTNEADFTTLFASGETTGTFPGEVNEGGTDVFVLRLEQDEDVDAIYNDVDILPGNPSDEFTDGVTNGTIIDRGTQELMVIGAYDQETGIVVEATPESDPSDPATIDACESAASTVLEPGEAVHMTCGSAIIEAISGIIDTTFTANDGLTATTALAEGNTIRFAVGSLEFTTPETNTSPVALSIGSTEHVLAPGAKTIFAPLLKDSFLRKGKANTNEGANIEVLVRNEGDIRSLFAFDLSNIPLAGLRKATLLLSVNPAPAPSGWGNNGRMIDAYPLTVDFAEGNGKDIDIPEAESTRGTGEGVTWKCATDTNIDNHQKDCAGDWDGGETAMGPKTAPGFLMKNNYLGQASWDVTQDVLAGNTRWLVKKRDENKNGHARFFSREGAPGQGNFIPQLVLEFE